MGADDTAMAVSAVSCRTRLKREDCKKTKHDSVFSHWKVLIGPSDWEDHSQGKEGAERYRVHNLPNCTSCAGIYELGVVGSHYWPRQESEKLDYKSIIAVYLGKSNNVRNRLQQYGRDGAHLERVSFSCTLLPQSGTGLFSEMFSKGFSIVYRWAPMKSSRDALKTESDLLDTFDYAWNKDSNGTRRQEDILRKIDPILKASHFLAKYNLFPKKATGIEIMIFKPPHLDNKGDTLHTELSSNNIFHRIFNFGRSRPKIVLPWRSAVYEDPRTCGVALGHGVICQRLPAEGRKRCEEHKGMKVNGFTGKLKTNTNGKISVEVNTNLLEQQTSTICGVIMGDGSPCARDPIKGNKRCLKHKGQRIRNSISKLEKDDKEHYVQGSILNEKRLRQNMATVSPCESEICREGGDNICGVYLDNKTLCTSQPPKGRKRCEEHKGMRIKKTNSKYFTEHNPSAFDTCVSKY